MNALEVEREDEEPENKARRPQRATDATDGTLPAAHLIREMQALAVGTLTPTQLRRLSSRLEGKSLATIADTENCSVASVHETLRAPKVQATFLILGQTMAAQDRNTGEKVDLVVTLLENLSQIALGATRTVQVGDRLEHVADYRMRFDASVKLLSLATPLKSVSDGDGATLALKRP